MAIDAFSMQWGSFNKMYWGTAAPTLSTDGTFQKGDVIWNNTPSASNPPGWLCVTGGSPGTWKAMGNIAA